MKNKPPNKECPQCGHKFRNFKWRRSLKYDAHVAACPKCKLPAVEWHDFQKPLKKAIDTMEKGTN